MKSKLVLVEVNLQGDPIRIFRTVKDSLQVDVESVQEVPKAYAVGAIRRQVFARAGCTPHQIGECEWCGRNISWETGEMHEKVFKGKGGEVSVVNSVAICHECHQGKNGAHGNRRWHSAKLKEM